MYRPYMSLDIETTGLNKEKSEVLQIAAVLDNGGPLESLPAFNVYIKNPTITHLEDGAFGMNINLMSSIANTKVGDNINGVPVLTLAEAYEQLNIFFLNSYKLAYKWDKDNGIGKNYNGKYVRNLQLAGKNVAAFDVPILVSAGKRWNVEFPIKSIDYRFLDAGSMFFSKFGYIAGLDDINKLTGRQPVSHDGVRDAKDVIAAVRLAYGLTKEQIELGFTPETNASVRV